MDDPVCKWTGDSACSGLFVFYGLWKSSCGLGLLRRENVYENKSALGTSRGGRGWNNSVLYLSEETADFPGEGSAQTGVEDSQLSRHLSQAMVLPSFGLRGVITSLQIRILRREKELPTVMQTGKWQKWETQTSGLLPQGSLHHSIFRLFSLTSKFYYLYLLKGSSTFKAWMIFIEKQK